MVRLRPSRRFGRSGQPGTGPAYENAPERVGEDARRVAFRRTAAMRRSRVRPRSTVWLIVLMAVVVGLILLLR